MYENRFFEDFVSLINALHKEIQRIMTTEGARLGFKGGDVMCLYYLMNNPEGLTSSELAAKADVSRAAMSRTVARLESEGMITVGGTSETQYRAPIRLTEKGQEATTGMSKIIEDVIGATSMVITPTQRRHMYAALNLIYKELEKFEYEPDEEPEEESAEGIEPVEAKE